MGKTVNSRTTEYEIGDIFLKRYSPRAMSGDPVSREELMTLLEAGRWAPSAFNAQPWRFLYALSGTPDFDVFLSFLMEANQVWCKKAGAFVIVLSKKTSRDKPNATHMLDTGAAWENLALQATEMNLVCHGMAGYNADILRKELSVPEDYEIGLMVALGKPGKIEDLPEALREREKPSDRDKLIEMAFEGKEGAKNLK